MTIEQAKLLGYTKEVELDSDMYNLHILVKPDADLDSSFKAYCLDEYEMIKVNGWMFY